MTSDEAIKKCLARGWDIRIPNGIDAHGAAAVVSHRGYIKGTGHGPSLASALTAAYSDAMEGK